MNIETNQSSKSYHDVNGQNGWSKYQIMVLQQLEDHSRVLQNLNKDIVDIKQYMAVSEAEIKGWRNSTTAALDSLEKKMSFVLYDEKGLNQKVNQIERDLDVDEKSTMKVKAIWAFIGAVVASLSSFIFQIVEMFWKE